MRQKQFLLFLGWALLILGGFWLGTRVASKAPVTFENSNLAAGSVEKFNLLAGASSNSCGLIGQEIISNMSDEQRIQGSCCSAMNMHRYQEQVEGLKEYSEISQVSTDPYDIPVSLAKELLKYKNEISLSSDEQKTYEEAMTISDEGGPCCCRCWRWDAFEGQAKYLITNENFTSEQIAELWDLQDGCGGSGHATEHS